MWSSRILYDGDYIDSNCTLPYDPTTKVDDTVGTWATNYAIAAIGLLAAAYYRQRIFPMAYFCLTAIGYAMAGWNHQQYDSTEDSDVWELLSHIGTSLGVWAWTCHVWELIATRNEAASKKNYQIISLVFLVVCVVCLILAWVLSSQTIVGLYQAISHLLLSLVLGYYTCGQRGRPGEQRLQFGFPSLGGFFIVGGFILQAVLAGTCGDDGYDSCFQDCPLQDPMTFNHNAWFHVLVAVGMVLQALGGTKSSERTVTEPSTGLEQPELSNVDPEVTVPVD